MIEANSLAEILLQCGVLLLLGALLMPLGRLLRFRHSEPGISNPRSSALWALFAIGVGWVLVLAFLLAVSGGARIESRDSQYVSDANAGDVVAQLMLALVAFGPALITMRRRREPLSSSGVSAKNLGRSLLVSVFLISAFVVWCLLVPRQCDATNLSRMAGVWALLQFAVVGFAEEFAYRGYLQTRLISWVGRYQGWVLASVLMAMAHIGHRVVILRMSGGDALASSASLIPISMFLGYVMLRTQSIIAPGLLHTMINWLGL